MDMPTELCMEIPRDNNPTLQSIFLIEFQQVSPRAAQTIP
jgi:hypothetical protein